MGRMEREPQDTHIVDRLIEERAVRLRQSRAWPLVKAVFYPLLGYSRAVQVADAIAGLSGRDALDWAEGFLSMRVEAHGLERLPGEGACVIVANHPGGIADGIAVWQAIKARRPDAVFFANLDAIRVCPGLAERVIPVEWRVTARSRQKTRETLRLAVQAFREQRCVVVFPAGRMSVWSWKRWRLVEQEWMPTAAGLAKKFGAPVLPVGIRQRMSLAFYALGQVHEELKHMTVFHELLAKRGARYCLAFGPARDPDADLPRSEAGATQVLRAETEVLAGRA
ncbi:1-acyl-sn-glycerol-3-phosphate acyltransferase [Marinicauda algicola]|nr:1-acyl-sn-glycerol-3-phosphate acyltransferase [Marinicauda algicola]